MLPAHESDRGHARLQREFQDHMLVSQYLHSNPSISFPHHESAEAENDLAGHLRSDSGQSLSNRLEAVRLERALAAAGMV